MLTIFIDPEELRPKGLKETYDWWVGNPNPLDLDARIVRGNCHLVREVQADGHELSWIREHLGVNRAVSGEIRVVRFFGDEAKFIAANLSERG